MTRQSRFIPTADITALEGEDATASQRSLGRGVGNHCRVSHTEECHLSKVPPLRHSDRPETIGVPLRPMGRDRLRGSNADSASEATQGQTHRTIRRAALPNLSFPLHETSNEGTGDDSRYAINLLRLVRDKRERPSGVGEVPDALNGQPRL